jgi:hypothetical protein
MKVSYVEGIANHNGLESCVSVRKDVGEALTEERIGRVLSREIHALPPRRQVLRDADAVAGGGRQHRVHRHRKVRQDPARSETPCMYGNPLRGNREVPRLPVAERATGRIGKSKDERRW